jgi:hypothetical protein
MNGTILIRIAAVADDDIDIIVIYRQDAKSHIRIADFELTSAGIFVCITLHGRECGEREPPEIIIVKCSAVAIVISQTVSVHRKIQYDIFIGIVI